ncbi:hypothetical protein HPB50_008335 [Hyalomma asiaticum]|uniref:Uncharacterized protein n=1 Tax=Hyalomma asiaticum TaxID=266040 RepID=A0ACB7RLQ0_HYAAI|nr:hypothetical protein HPB50_008335 [Hyalomma asiaticum]
MHLECIIPLLAEEGEILRDPRLELIVTGYCQLQAHDLKLVCFRDCAEENTDKDLENEEHQNRERPLPLVDITECSETNGGYEVVDGVTARRPESVNSFLSPKFSPEPSLTDSEKQPMDVATKSDSGSMSEQSSNCAERAHLVNMEGGLLVNGHAGTPPCDVSVLHEPISTGTMEIHECEHNRHVNGTVHMNGFGHIRKAQRTNGVVSWLSHVDVPFSSDTGRSYPCERGVWPGRVIPLNPVTEDTLQDPRLASPKSRPRVEGRFVLTPIDVERSQGENVACRQEYGNESNSQFSPASGPPPFLDTSCHESNVDVARAKSVEDLTEDVVEIKQEPQEMDTPEERPECESGLSKAQIEQWLAANRRLWDHSFMQSPQVPSEPPPSVYSPSSVLSPLYSPDILSSSSAVSSVGGQLPVQVTCPESEGQAPPQKDSGQARAAPMRQPGCQNSEPSPVGPELPQAGYLGYHSPNFTPWTMWTYCFPLQPLWSQVPLEQQSLSVAATQMPSFSVAAAMEHSSAREAPLMLTSEQTLAQSLNEQAASVSAYPWALLPSAQAQLGSMPRNQEWYSGVPLFLPPQCEEVSLSTSVPQQQQLHESSCLPTPAQPSSGLSQLPPYDEPTSFAPPAAQSLEVPQALATDIAHPQAQPELDMPMESQVMESSYVYGEIPPKPILESDSQATLQEAPIDSEQMQVAIRLTT